MITNLKGKLKSMSSTCPLNEVKPEHSPAHHSRENLGGEVIYGLSGQHICKRTIYPLDHKYGNILLSRMLEFSFEGNVPRWSKLDCEFDIYDMLFLDTETTGLARGTGTSAFLVGLGYFTEAGLVIEQHIMRDFDEELSMLSSVHSILQRYKVLVTFNGKCFDWPLLESRMVYSRLRPMTWEGAHLDLLHTARRLWGLKLDSCSLISLEKNILNQHREDDIPGSLIPNIYMEFIQSQKSRDMLKVMEHNEWDIAAMVALFNHIHTLYQNPATLCDDYELLCMAREMEKEKNTTEAIEYYLLCIENTQEHFLSLEAKKRLAYLLKRNSRSQEAMALWSEMAGRQGNSWIFPFIEMAKYMEHKEKNYSKALEYTDQAIHVVNERDSILSSQVRDDILSRKKRLLKKIERKECL